MFVEIGIVLESLLFLFVYIYYLKPKRKLFLEKSLIHKRRTNRTDGCQRCGRLVYPGDLMYACGTCEVDYRW